MHILMLVSCSKSLSNLRFFFLLWSVTVFINYLLFITGQLRNKKHEIHGLGDKGLWGNSAHNSYWHFGKYSASSELAYPSSAYFLISWIYKMMACLLDSKKFHVSRRFLIILFNNYYFTEYSSELYYLTNIPKIYFDYSWNRRVFWNPTIFFSKQYWYLNYPITNFRKKIASWMFVWTTLLEAELQHSKFMCWSLKAHDSESDSI